MTTFTANGRPLTWRPPASCLPLRGNTLTTQEQLTHVRTLHTLKHNALSIWRTHHDATTLQTDGPTELIASYHDNASQHLLGSNGGTNANV